MVVPELDHLRDLIETLRVVRMSQELRLDEEEAARLAVRVRELREEREELDHLRAELLPKIARLLQEADRERREPPEERLSELIERMQEEQERHREEIERLEQRIQEALTIEQQARFLLFEKQFEQEVQRMIRLAREMAPPPQKSPRPEPPPGWREGDELSAPPESRPPRKPPESKSSSK
jgi:hypothetical protein